MAAKKKFPKKATNIMLDPRLKAAASKHAYDGNESLSELVERLVVQELAHPTGQLFDEGSPSVDTAALDILHRAKNAPSKGKTQPPKSSKKRPSVRG